MKNLKRCYFILLIALVVCSCQKDEPMVPPVIRATAASDITNTTAVINAEITEAGSEPILKYGFVWAEGYDDISTLDDGTIQYLEGSPNEGVISFELKNLEQGKKYSYNAFIQTETDIYMNKYDMGFSMAQPEITDINPKEGSGGTKVTITGKYFTTDKEAISLELGSDEAEILEASETEITFIAPDGYAGDKDIELYLVVNGATSQSEITFKYLRYFTLNEEYIRSDQSIGVFVSGYLPMNSETNRADINFKINGKLCEVISEWPGDKGYTVTVQTPKDLQPGVADLEVTSGSGYKYYNKNNTLTVLPPDTWLKKNNLPEKQMGDGFGFTKGDFAYVLSNQKLYQYSPTNDSWSLYKEILSLQNKKADAIGLIDEELLILKGKTLKSFNFYGDYSQARAEFPGEKRSGAISFVVNNNFYYGLGYIGDVFQNDLWKYDLDKDEWTRVADCPSRNHSLTYKEDAFVNGDKVIIEQFEYDYITDTYKESESSFNPFGVSLLLDNKAYSITTDNYVYVSSDNTKIKYRSVLEISNYSFDNDIRTINTCCPGHYSPHYFAFVINGKIYIGGDNDNLEFWEFTPADY
ncbi:IPT/TIG domain-containing protein [Labilibaculum euxinus]